MKRGKFLIVSTRTDYFDSAEEREHHIKEHLPVTFEAKTDLLTKRKFVFTFDPEDSFDDENAETVITLEEAK